MAETVGFEPTKVLPPQISNLLHYHYATLPIKLNPEGLQGVGILFNVLTYTRPLF